TLPRHLPDPLPLRVDHGRGAIYEGLLKSDVTDLLHQAFLAVGFAEDLLAPFEVATELGRSRFADRIVALLEQLLDRVEARLRIRLPPQVLEEGIEEHR